MLTREEVIAMLKEVYNNDSLFMTIAKSRFPKIQNSQKRIKGLHQVAEPIQRLTFMMKMAVHVNVRRHLL